MFKFNSTFFLKLFIFILSLSFSCILKAQSPYETILLKAQQIFLVVVDNPDAPRGTGYLFEKNSTIALWKPIGHPFPLVVGKNGIAWARRFKKDFDFHGLYKKEGDNRSPAGIFQLTHAFGDQTINKKNLKLPYFVINKNTVCVDDASSKFYNTIVTTTPEAKDWNSAEIMSSIIGYRRGVIVNYNFTRMQQDITEKQPRKNLGSCIFLHVWSNEHQGTAGCIAMSYQNMEKIFYWLKKDKNPLVIVIPKSELRAVALVMPEFKKITLALNTRFK